MAKTEPRFSTSEQAPQLYRAMATLQERVNNSVDPVLNELIKIRSSQLNGCACCIDMHTKDARAAGEGEQRIYALSAWRETPFFTGRERAALALTEAVTLVHDGHVPDEVYDEAAQALRPARAGRTRLGRRRDQCLEPGRHHQPVGAGKLRTRGGSMSTAAGQSGTK